MAGFTDLGYRCPRHVGEVYPVRCYDCLDAPTRPKPAPIINGSCALHPDYPATDRFECARCARDREGQP